MPPVWLLTLGSLGCFKFASPTYTVHPVSAETIAHQRASFTALLQSLGQASFAEIEAVMAEREVVEPEEGLSPEVVMRLQKRLADQ